MSGRRGKRPDATLEQRAAAVDMVRRGASVDDVASAIGYSTGAVRSWLLADRRAAPAQPPPAEDDPADDVPEFDPHAPAIDVLRATVAALQRAHAIAARTGDVRAAQHVARTLSSAVPQLARLERMAQDDGDVIRISRAELAEAAAAYRQRVAAIVARPLTCARCGAVLRAEVAGVELAPTAPAGGA